VNNESIVFLYLLFFVTIAIILDRSLFYTTSDAICPKFVVIVLWTFHSVKRAILAYRTRKIKDNEDADLLGIKMSNQRSESNG